MDQIFHSWCMGSNLGNLEPGSPEDGVGWGMQSLEKALLQHRAGEVWICQQLTLSAVLMIKVCPEVRVCGFGSSPRFGSTVDGDWCAAAAEVWSSVVVWEEFCSGGGNWWIPCIIQPLTIPRQKGAACVD